MEERGRPCVFRAPWTALAADRGGRVRFASGGGLFVRGGRIERVLPSEGALRRVARGAGVAPRELEGVLLPGLVNAHAHLELTRLGGRLTPGADFVRWVGEVVMALGGLPADERVASTREGAHRCLETGTTTVGDIDSTGAHTGSLPLRRVLHREVLDARDADRTPAAIERVRRPLPARRLRSEGLSPHGPHTVGPRLARAAAELARSRDLPLSIHWAESAEEVRFLRAGDGPFAAWLGESPRRPGLDLLADAGLLGPRTSLVHGNHPEPDDPKRVARAGCTLVHCPGSHAFFDRPPFPHARWSRAGVPVALGTDSLASNRDLDLRREMALYRGACPEVGADEAFAAATVHGARALGGSELGRLAAGCAADFFLCRLASSRPEDFLEELTRGGGEVLGTWVAGRRRRLRAS